MTEEDNEVANQIDEETLYDLVQHKLSIKLSIEQN
jgi:hypothetical protein